MYFFTSDEHYGHRKIIEYCNRPFSVIEEMDEEIIKRHNEVVKKNDFVIHGGDLTLIKKPEIVWKNYINRLNGEHAFIQGSHDQWNNALSHRWEKTIHGQHIVVDHYAMLVWPRSHYGSWQLYGHSHGGLSHGSPVVMGKQWDIGVDNNNFYPLSFDQIVEIMKSRPDNFNLIKKR